MEKTIKIFLTLALFFCALFTSKAQNVPQVHAIIAQATYGNSDNYNPTHAQSAGDKAYIFFKVNGTGVQSLPPDNEYIIEMSKKDGTFDDTVFENNTLLVKLKTNGLAPAVVTFPIEEPGKEPKVKYFPMQGGVAGHIVNVRTNGFPNIDCGVYKIRIRNSYDNHYRIIGDGPVVSNWEEYLLINDKITKTDFKFEGKTFQNNPTINDNKDVFICDGTPAELKITGEFAKPEYAGVKFKWVMQKNDSSQEEDVPGDGPSIKVSTPGKYKVRVFYGECEGSIDDGKKKFSAEVSVSKSEDFYMTANGDKIGGELFLCQGQASSIDLMTALGNLGGTFEYTWKKDNTTLSQGSDEYFLEIDSSSPDFEGTYSVFVNTNSCILKSSVRVSLLKKPSSVTLNANREIFVPGLDNSLVLDIQGLPNISDVTHSVQWIKTPSDLPDPVEKSPGVYEVQKPGAYQAKVILTSSGGSCSVESDPTSEVKFFTLGKVETSLGNPPNNGLLCSEPSYFLSVNRIVLTAKEDTTKIQEVASSEFNKLNYIWSEENGGTPNAIQDNSGYDIEIGDPHPSGKYRVKVSFDDPSISSDFTPWVEIYVKDTSTVTISDTNSPYICSGNPYTFKALIKGQESSTATYKWYRDDVEIQGATQGTYTTSEVGKYKVVIPADGVNFKCELSSKVIDLKENPFGIAFEGEEREDVGGVATLKAKPIHSFVGKYVLRTHLPMPPSGGMDKVFVQWYKDGAMFDEGLWEDKKEFEVTEPGKYVVKVKDENGCNNWDATTLEQEIKTAVGYKPVISGCPGALKLDKIITTLSDGSTIDIENTNADIDHFSFLWSEIDQSNSSVPIEGANSMDYNYDKNSKVGVSKFVLSISLKEPTSAAPTFTPSDVFQVNSPDIFIDSKSAQQERLITKSVLSVILEGKSGDNVGFTLEADPSLVDTTTYSYTWTKPDGSQQQGTSISLSGEYSSLLGRYQLSISDLSGTSLCDLSREIEILQKRPLSVSSGVNSNLPFQEDSTTGIVYSGVEIVEGVKQNIAINGNYDYLLVKSPSGDDVQIGQDNKSFDVDRVGNYQVTLRRGDQNSGTDIISFFVSVTEKEVPNIPNVVLLRSEVGNNRWILPRQYRDPKCKVEIYDSYGKKVFSGFDYGANAKFWPGDDFQIKEEDKGKSDIYFYIIEKDSKKIQGTITLLH